MAFGNIDAPADDGASLDLALRERAGAGLDSHGIARVGAASGHCREGGGIRFGSEKRRDGCEDLPGGHAMLHVPVCVLGA
jgi:hypothetical protein